MGGSILKEHFSKAFDMVDWEFLSFLLHKVLETTGLHMLQRSSTLPRRKSLLTTPN